jgi:ATP-dependent RNA helicase DeaD
MPFPPLPVPLKESLDARGYQEPTAVQSAILDLNNSQTDLLVSAQTGSGKTIAFGLAVSECVLEGAPKPAVLVIAPTRELALQVARELGWLYAKTPARIASCVGGMDPNRERQALKAGATVVVGTPGRLCDHLDRGNLDLSGIKALILDEGDEMLDMGFKEELEHLLQAAPSERRTLLFSATMPPEIEKLAQQYQKNALRISTRNSTEPHADITWKTLLVSPRERDHAIVNLLLLEDPPRALVFCATREEVARVHSVLLERGFAAAILSGELSQAERSRALWALRDGRARVLVATDVAARGLDLPSLDLVIHADLPRDPPTMIHRSGRTGRAGRRGTAALLCPFSRKRFAERMLQSLKIPFRWEAPPDAAEVFERTQARVRAEIEAMPPGEEEDRLIGSQLLEKLGAEAVAGMLVKLCREKRPQAEELPETGGSWNKIVRNQETRENREPYKPKHHASKAEKRPVTWFRVNLGRKDRAEPKWLIPLICRRGDVEKNEIGEIRIQPKETVFEIDAASAERFAAKARKPDRKNPGIIISKLKPEGA